MARHLPRQQQSQQSQASKRTQFADVPSSQVASAKALRKVRLSRCGGNAAAADGRPGCASQHHGPCAGGLLVDEASAAAVPGAADAVTCCLNCVPHVQLAATACQVLDLSLDAFSGHCDCLAISEMVPLANMMALRSDLAVGPTPNVSEPWALGPTASFLQVIWDLMAVLHPKAQVATDAADAQR